MLMDRVTNAHIPPPKGKSVEVATREWVGDGIYML